jgi:hypothetical protein
MFLKDSLQQRNENESKHFFCQKKFENLAVFNDNHYHKYTNVEEPHKE